jgi:hypothetical protein
VICCGARPTWKRRSWRQLSTKMIFKPSKVWAPQLDWGSSISRLVYFQSFSIFYFAAQFSDESSFLDDQDVGSTAG